MVVFLSGVRTGFGAFGGSLKNLSPTDLGVVAAQGAIERSGLATGDIGHVVFGNVMQSASDAIYLARHVGLRAGLLVETPGGDRQPTLWLRGSSRSCRARSSSSWVKRKRCWPAARSR
jgi:acetyl-CoA acetyltransferase